MHFALLYKKGYRLQIIKMPSRLLWQTHDSYKVLLQYVSILLLNGILRSVLPKLQITVSSSKSKSSGFARR